MDEAQADRLRVLAAFAVTVGSTGAVADLFGLSEREVRVARRTVGKEDARAVADDLLAAATAPPAMPPVESVDEDDEDEDVASPSGVSEGVGATSGGVVGEPSVSAAVDAVLVGSWQTGVDLRELAAELGLDLSRLVARAQQLSAQGRLPSGPVQEGYGGRHRKSTNESHEAECSIPAQQPGSWGAVSSAQAVPSAWYSTGTPSVEAVAEVTAVPTDWDQALAAWGQFAPPYEEPPPVAASAQPWMQYHLSS
ncbi:hypothetical protein [Streptomyces piniterrae]|uniref:hypothetical protein n=1 Tax=Streptomyces piniterrae TaxID=2571125 RepID=UPI003CCC4E8C